jgi:hypothetical protein
MQKEQGMSNQELYEIARRRIDRRNRRWTLWAVDLAGLIISVAALIFLSNTAYVTLAAAFMMAWAGIFVLHTIVASTAHSRDEDIEKEIAKLREADLAYEKPKRLHLTEDGELAEDEDWVEEGMKVKRT